MFGSLYSIRGSRWKYRPAAAAPKIGKAPHCQVGGLRVKKEKGSLSNKTGGLCVLPHHCVVLAMQVAHQCPCVSHPMATQLGLDRLANAHWLTEHIEEGRLLHFATFLDDDDDDENELFEKENSK